MFRLLFVLFLLIPLIELFVLIEVGQVVGAGWTILLVLATAILGAFLVKLQGLQTLQRAQASVREGKAPALEMMEGAALLISGVMLLIPGFVTDAMGFALLIPPLRRALLKRLIANSDLVFRGRFHQSPTSRSGDVIDGEVVDDDDPRHLR